MRLYLPSVRRSAPVKPKSSQNSLSVAVQWLGAPFKFDIVQDQVLLHGFQIYAVEKWVVERTRALTVLVVFTGDPEHVIKVTALAPSSSLSPVEANQEWEAALRHLRQDGSKPRQVNDGTVLATSLANFRSDFTIVHIPDGDFLNARSQLYANINLLRMGCGGRSAVSLSDCSDSTRARFLSMYHLPELALSHPFVYSPPGSTLSLQLDTITPTVRTRKKCMTFNSCVLELVKLVQAGLALFGMFPLDPGNMDGLLCDITLRGVQRWVSEIGGPCIGLEPIERVLDPVFVSAILSLVLTIRNKLAALVNNHNIPKDPFLHPRSFSACLASYLQSSSTSSTPNPTSHSSIGNPTALLIPSNSSLITRTFIDTLTAAHERAQRADARRVHRVLLNNVRASQDGLPRLGLSLGGAPVTGPAAVLEPVSDMATFAQAVSCRERRMNRSRKGSGADPEGDERSADVLGVGGSVRALWSGRVMDLVRLRAALSQASSPVSGVVSDGGEGAETEDESEVSSLPWSGRVRGKLGSWAGLGKLDGRWKAKSVDLSPMREVPSEVSRTSIVAEPQSPTLPSVSCEDEDSGTDWRKSEREQAYATRLSRFDARRLRVLQQGRIASWADPKSARDEGSATESANGSGAGDHQQDPGRLETGVIIVEEPEPMQPSLRRRASYHDSAEFAGTRVLPVDRMRIDVEIAGQILIMARRSEHLESIIRCMYALNHALAGKNSDLRTDVQAHQAALSELEGRTAVVGGLDEANAGAEMVRQETNVLSYESEQFRVGALLRTALLSRRAVLALRSQVLGEGPRTRRLQPGTRGAHGRFTRAQRMLDGSIQLVDSKGRTESEVEEEEEAGVSEEEEEEELQQDAVENPRIKPMWLLRFFTEWGAWVGGFGVKKEKESAGVGSGKLE